MSEAVDTLDKGKNKEGRKASASLSARLAKSWTGRRFRRRKMLRNTTIIVIISVIFFAIYLFLIDQAWIYILEGSDVGGQQDRRVYKDF